MRQSELLPHNQTESDAIEFFDLEYAAKKKTRPDRFLAEIETITPWPALEAEIESFYPKGDGRCPLRTGPWERELFSVSSCLSP